MAASAGSAEPQPIEMDDVDSLHGGPDQPPPPKYPRHAKPNAAVYSIVDNLSDSGDSHDDVEEETHKPSSLELHELSTNHSITWKIIVLFILFGFGPSWVLHDGMYIQIPYWQRSQPEGLTLANKMTIASTMNLVTVFPIYFMIANNIGNHRISFRKLCYAIFALQILSSLCISIAWPYTIGNVSVVIHSVCFVSSVGGHMMSIVIVPWVTSINSKLCVPILTGVHLSPLASAMIGMVQQPGNEQPMFGPSMYFTIFWLFFAMSLLAFVYLDIMYLKQIEKVLQQQARKTHELEMAMRTEKFANSSCPGLHTHVFWTFTVPVWWRQILGYTLMVAYIGVVTWVFVRSTVPYAIKHASTAEQGDNTQMEQYAIELSYIAVPFGSVLAIFLVVQQWKYFVALMSVYSVFAAIFLIIAFDDESGLWVFWNSDKFVVLLVFLMRCIDGYVVPLILENVARQYPKKAHAMNQWIAATASMVGFTGVWLAYFFIGFFL